MLTCLRLTKSLNSTLVAHEHDTPRPADPFPSNHLRLVNLPLKISATLPPKESSMLTQHTYLYSGIVAASFQRHGKSYSHLLISLLLRCILL